MLKEYYKSSFLVLVVICVCCNNTIKSDTSLSALQDSILISKVDSNSIVMLQNYAENYRVESTSLSKTSNIEYEFICKSYYDNQKETKKYLELIMLKLLLAHLKFGGQSYAIFDEPYRDSMKDSLHNAVQYFFIKNNPQVVSYEFITSGVAEMYLMANKKKLLKYEPIKLVYEDIQFEEKKIEEYFKSNE